MFVKRSLIFAILTILGTTALSQSENFGNQLNSHIFRFSSSLETVSIEDALEYSSDRVGYKWNFSASVDQATDTLIAIDSDNNDEVLSYVDNIQTLNLGTSYLLRNSLLFGAALPVHFVTLTAQGDQVTGGGVEKAITLGDANIFLKWRLTGKGSKLNFAIMPRIILPTGDTALLVSDGFGFGLRGLLSYQARSFKLYSHFGFLSTPDSGFLSVTRAQRIEAALGLLFKLTRSLGLNAEITGDVAFGGETGVDQNTVSVLAGLRISFSKKLKLFAGLAINGILEAQAQEFGYYAGLKFAFGEDKQALEEKEVIARKTEEQTQVKPSETPKKKVATVGKRPGELEYSGFEIKSNGQSGVSQALNTSVLERNYQVPTTRYQKVQTAQGTKYKEIPEIEEITPTTKLAKVRTSQGVLYSPQSAVAAKVFKKVKTPSGIQYKAVAQEQKIAFQKVNTPQGPAYKEVESITKPVFEKVKTSQGVVYNKVETVKAPVIKKIRTSRGFIFKQVVEPELPIYQKVKTARGTQYKNVAVKKVAKFKRVQTPQGIVFTEIAEPKFEQVKTPASTRVKYREISQEKPVLQKFITSQGTIFKKVNKVPTSVFEEVKTINGTSYKQSAPPAKTYFQEVRQSNGQIEYKAISVKKAKRIVEKEIAKTVNKSVFKKINTNRGVKYKEIVEVPKVVAQTKLKAVKTKSGTIYQPQSLAKKPLFKKIQTSKGVEYKKIETPKIATYKKIKTSQGTIFKEVKSIEQPKFKKVQTQQGLIYKKVSVEKEPIIQRIRTAQGIKFKQVQAPQPTKFKEVRTLTGVQYKKVSTPVQPEFKRVETKNGAVFREVVKPIFVKKQDTTGRISYAKTPVINPIFKKFVTAQGTIYKQVKEAPKANFKEVQTSKGVTYKEVNDTPETYFQEVKTGNGKFEYKKVSTRTATRALVAFEKISKPSPLISQQVTAADLTQERPEDIEVINQPILKKVQTRSGIVYKQNPIIAPTKYEKVKTASGSKYVEVKPEIKTTFKKVQTNQGTVYKEVAEKTFKKVKTRSGFKYQETYAPTSIFKKIKTPQGTIYKAAAQLIKPPVIKKIRTSKGVVYKQIQAPSDIKYTKVKTASGTIYKKSTTTPTSEYKKVETPQGLVYTEIVKPKFKKVKTASGTVYKKEVTANPVYKKFETAQGTIYRQVTEVPKAIFKEVTTLDGQTEYKKVVTAPETFFQEVQTLSGQTTYKEITPRLAQSILQPLPTYKEPLYRSKNLEKKVNKEISIAQRSDLPTPIQTDSEGKVIKFTNRTLFRFNKYDLSDEAKQILRKVAKVIKKYERRIGRIQILGHTDTIGTIWYNRFLSEKRAVAVKKYLIDIGINPRILDAYGMGEEQPRVFPERTEADRQANRRAEFYFKLLFRKTAQP